MSWQRALLFCCAVLTTQSTGAASPTLSSSASQQQHRHQQQVATVLEATASGVIKSASALRLLNDLQQLRQSLDTAGSPAAARCSITQHQQNADTAKQPPSRGILVVAGGSSQFRNAYTLLSLLCHPDVACKLPIELVYYGQHEYDAAAAAAMLQLAQQHSVSLRFIDGSAVPPTATGAEVEPHPPPGRITGFKAKVHALVWVTSFDHVIMLDSDNSPLTDPTPLLDSAPFKTHGSIFWPDFWRDQWMKPALYSLLGLDTPWEVNPAFRACEAGQVVLDRLRHRDVLEYLWLLNLHSNSGIPGAELGVVGQCLWGDKDTYPIAFHLAGKAADFYSVEHTPLQALSRPSGEGSTRLAHAGMVQRAPWGKGPLMWLHRTAAGKMFPHCVKGLLKPCRIWGLTTPVDQQQLLASVKDPSAMEMTTQQVDLEWRVQHCNTTSSSHSSCGSGQVSSAEGGGSELGQCSFETGSEGDGAVGGSSHSTATVLPCDLAAAVGVLPIPVLRTRHLPAQVKRLLQAGQKAFKAASML